MAVSSSAVPHPQEDPQQDASPPACEATASSAYFFLTFSLMRSAIGGASFTSILFDVSLGHARVACQGRPGRFLAWRTDPVGANPLWMAKGEDRWTSPWWAAARRG